MIAVEHAYRVLNWQENLRDEEMPPDWMWPFDELIVDWFNEIKEKRAAEARGERVESSTGGEGPMMQNELAQGRGRNA